MRATPLEMYKQPTAFQDRREVRFQARFSF
jgi:hypothetical protein